MPAAKHLRLCLTFLLGIGTALLISRMIPGKHILPFTQSDTSALSSSSHTSASASTETDSTKATKSQREPSTTPKRHYLSADETEQVFRKLLASPPSTARLHEIFKLMSSLNPEVVFEFIDQDRWEFLRTALTEQEANQIGDALGGHLRQDGTRAEFIFLLNHGDSMFFPFSVSELTEGIPRMMDARQAYDAILKGNLTDKQRKDLKDRTAYEFGSTNPQQFLSLAYQKEGQEVLKENGEKFIEGWSYKSPTEAVEWTLTLPRGSDSEQALRKKLVDTSMRDWIRSDTYQATKWLAARPRDTNTDQLTSIVATSMSTSEKDSAMSWANTIQDEALKQETIKQIEFWVKLKQ